MNISRCKERNGLSLVPASLYRQIDRENVRNRRRHEIEYIQGLIGMLDFVLSRAQWKYLETEPEKISFFCDQLQVPILNSTPVWSSSWTVALRKRRRSASVLLFHPSKLLQVLQEIAKNWTSN